MPSLADRRQLVTEDDVVAAMRGEERLLGMLTSALAAQRNGIATADVPAVETATRSVSRLILTLDEARRQREWLARDLAREDENSEAPTHRRPELAAARDAVRRGAQRVASDLAVNQRILARALKAGDAYLQALFATVATTGTTYTESAHVAPSRPSGVVVNARA